MGHGDALTRFFREESRTLCHEYVRMHLGITWRMDLPRLVFLDDIRHSDAEKARARYDEAFSRFWHAN